MINVYDFDGTIYNGDSSIDFYLYCLKRNPSIVLLLPIQVFGILMCKLKLKNKEYAKEKFFCFLKKIKNIDNYVNDFWKKNDCKIKKWYLDQKDKTDVIISASPEFLLKPLKKKLGIDRVIASKVNKKTGVFESKNCYGEEKISRYKADMKKKNNIKCFYSDSIEADKPMMEYSQRVYLVNGDDVEKIEDINHYIKKDSLIVRLFLVVFFLTFGYIFLNVIFNNNNTIPRCSLFDIFLSFIIYGLFLVLIYKLLKKIELKPFVKIIIFIIFIAFQLLFAYYFVVEPSWDFGAVYNAAISHINGGAKIYDDFYFYRYGNNLGLVLALIFYYRVFKFFGITCYTTLGILLNIFMIDICIIYICKIIGKCFSKKNVNYFIFLTSLFTPFVTYVPIFYTDTISLPFAVAGLYYYFVALDMQKSKKKIFFYSLSGLLFGLGGIIKITVLIVFVALIVFHVFTIKKEDIKLYISRFLIIILFVFIPLFSLKLYKKIRFDTVRLNHESFPYTHWIMMGMHDLGSYYHSDVEYTASFSTYKEKVDANIEIAKKRLKEKIDNNTLISSYTNKTVYVFGDGTFFAPEKLHRLEVNNYSFKDYILRTSKNRFYLDFAHIEWVVCFMFILFGVLFRKFLTEFQKNLQLIVCITMFGLFLFFILWEARSRYLVNMIPIMLIGGYLGMEAFFKYIEFLKKRKQNN